MTDKVIKLRYEATKWAVEHEPCGIFGPFPSRTCWHCNPAHDWMKTDMETPYHCYECGHIYFKGVRLTEEGEEA